MGKKQKHQARTDYTPDPAELLGKVAPDEEPEEEAEEIQEPAEQIEEPEEIQEPEAELPGIPVPNPETPEDTQEQPETPEPPASQEDTDISALETLLSNLPDIPATKEAREGLRKAIDAVIASKTKLGELNTRIASLEKTQPKNPFAELDKLLKSSGIEVTTEMVGTTVTLESIVRFAEKQSGITLENRQVVLKFPKDKDFVYTHSVIGKSGNGGGRSSGEKVGGVIFVTTANGEYTDLKSDEQKALERTTYASVHYENGNESANYKSLKSFCDGRGVKYEGRPTGTASVLNPISNEKDLNDNYLNTELPYRHTIVKDDKGVLQVRQIAR